MEIFSETIFEEREETMISPNGDSNPTLRTAHFLKPTIVVTHHHHHHHQQQSSVVQEKVAPFLLSSQPRSYNIKKLRKKINFHPSQYLDNNAWTSWVERLRSKHESTWKKAGIYEAILSSTYMIPKQNDVIFGVAEKWCPETNTFVFPWGEATISLEDMIVLGGFSVLGESVIPFDSKKNVVLKECLTGVPKNLNQNELLDQMCKEGGFEFEHESFLVMWLSRFVFPSRYNSIRKSVFPIADCLANGIKVALAPAVLASIYRGLSLLKAKLNACAELNEENHGDLLTVKAPFRFLQVWIWERFMELRPKPNLIQLGEPRFAKWDKLKTRRQKTMDDLRLVLDSAGNSFQWRPYSSSLHVYTNRERSVLLGSNLDEDILSYVRCIRVSELVGLDGIIEQYQPHRFAMQFGFDQDLPGYVARSNETVETAWENYTRPVEDVQLYIPAQLFEADVTTRYMEWWKPLLFDRRDAIKGVVTRKKRSSRRVMSLKQILLKKSSDDRHSTERNDHLQGSECIVDTFQHNKDIPPPPGFPHEYKRVEAEKSLDNDEIVQDRDKKQCTERRNDLLQYSQCIFNPFGDLINIPAPPGFPHKYKMPVEVEKCQDETLTIIGNDQVDESRDEMPTINIGNDQVDEISKSSPSVHSLCPNDVSRTVDVQDEAVVKGSDGEVDSGSPSNAGRYGCIGEIDIVLELESRISELEKVFSDLNQRNFGRQRLQRCIVCSSSWYRCLGEVQKIPGREDCLYRVIEIYWTRGI